MIEKFNFNALIIARESRGYSQLELAEKLQMPQGTLSKIENGNLPASSEFLASISSVLKYPKEFFCQEMQIYPPNLHFRKKNDAPAKVLSYAEAIMNIYRAGIQKLIKSITLPFTNLPMHERTSRRTPQQAAMLLRQFWQIPRGPIDNLCKIIEDKGIIIVNMDFGTDKIDGRSMVVDGGKFIIFVNKNIPGDRQRLTVAHELGHIVLHLYSTNVFDVDIEEEAFLFACELLMPENEIKVQLIGSKITIAKLADLKRYWKTSMQAILHWAETIKSITTNQAKYLWAQFNSLRIKQKEPIEIPTEKPSLLNEIISYYLVKLGYSKEDLAKTLTLDMSDFKASFLDVNNALRVA